MALPLVYATREAVIAGERLVPGCLENAVQAQILAGHVAANREAGVVFSSDKTWVARIRRVPARVQAKRRAWLVTAVETHRGRSSNVSAAGVSNDKTGALDTPKTGIPAIDEQAAKLQAEDQRRKSEAAREAEAGRQSD
jgi:hypothetical protein